MKREKLVKLEGVTLPDGQVMREVEDDGYKYLWIVEFFTTDVGFFLVPR